MYGDFDQIVTARFRFPTWVGTICHVLDTGCVTITDSVYKMAAGIKRSGREAYHRLLSRAKLNVKLYLLFPMSLDYVGFNCTLEIFA